MLESWGERRERGRGASFALRPRQHGRGGKGTSVFFIHLISLSFFLLSFSCFLLFLIILVFFLFFRYFPFPSSFLSSLHFHANRAKEDNFLITQSRFEERHLIFLSYQTADFYPRFINRINILEFKGITLLYTHNFSRAGKCIQSCIFVRSAYFLFCKKKKKITISDYSWTRGRIFCFLNWHWEKEHFDVYWFLSKDKKRKNKK